MRIKRFFDSFFVLSKSERNGAMVLLSIIILLIIFRFLIPSLNKSENSFQKDLDERLGQLEKIKDSLNRKDSHTKKTTFSALAKVVKSTKKADKEDSLNKNEVSMFRFDPNKVSPEELNRLGFSTFAARNLISFREKGGKIHQSEDLKRIYGIDSLFFIKIQPYVVIVEEKESIKTLIEINGADSSAFTTLKGIGPAYAARICKYRNYLGGFVSIDQLKEVYQFPEETFLAVKDYLTLDETKVIKININFADVKELKRHPYSGYEVARKIIEYRSKKGYVQNIEQLLVDSVIEKQVFNRLSPYLKVE
jgi:competence protein ComEA